MLCPLVLDVDIQKFLQTPISRTLIHKLRRNGLCVVANLSFLLSERIDEVLSAVLFQNLHLLGTDSFCFLLGCLLGFGSFGHLLVQLVRLVANKCENKMDWGSQKGYDF